jgi:hypothetical protein
MKTSIRFKRKSIRLPIHQIPIDKCISKLREHLQSRDHLDPFMRLDRTRSVMLTNTYEHLRTSRVAA